MYLNYQNKNGDSRSVNAENLLEGYRFYENDRFDDLRSDDEVLRNTIIRLLEVLHRKGLFLTEDVLEVLPSLDDVEYGTEVKIMY